MFVDKIHLNVQAGNGGNGCESFYCRTDRKVVPHGGDGGHGGSVIFRADTDAPSLSSFRLRKRISAEHGGHGGSTKKRGKNGDDITILVPPGTRLFDRGRNLLIRELAQAGDQVVVCAGGKGGTGNQGGRPATLGEKGQTIDLEITTRIPAKIFLVGLPNAGKSTFLNRLTRTHAREENFPFSTKSPELGVWNAPDYAQITICELPSIYEGSHEGRGMGNAFLKHLEEAPYILYFIEPLSQFAGSLKEGHKMLRREIEIFDDSLLEIPHAVIVNKIDAAGAKDRLKKEKFKPGAPVFAISALTGEGLQPLLDHMATLGF